MSTVIKWVLVVKCVFVSFLPLFTDTNAKGERKVSIGRFPLLVILLGMCKHYLITGVGPDVGILTFIGMAMAYNGFSKTKTANNDGSEKLF